MDETTLSEQWKKTLGPSPDWKTLSAGLTYKPAGGELEAGQRDAASLFLPTQTLSGGSTVGGSAAAATLSGGGTLAQGTLSGGGTMADPGTLSGGATLEFASTGERVAAPGTPAVANYEIVSEIARGGMGVVYRARQASLDREVALKQILPDQASDSARSKFVAEALVTGVLDHPNIIPVHELGRTPGGEVFLAMKLVGGKSWKDLLHPGEGLRPCRESAYDREGHIDVLLNVCNAVAFAHTKGVVHRDLKPENVMVGEFGEILVMDWGIAVDVRSDPGADTRAPHKSTVKAPSGTPSYMPPELAEGRGADIGRWTDVYLLGAILHEIVTGAPPHTGPTLLSVLLSASKSEPRQYGPDVPAALQAICRKAMARDVSDRYQSVPEFQDELKKYKKFRESMVICERAEKELRDLVAGGAELARQDRNRLYGRYAKAVARFEQALELWEGNEAAATGARGARIAYAKAALSLGDLGLAEAQVAPMPQADAEAGALRNEIKKAQALREKASRNSRMMRGGLIAAAALIIAGLAVGFLLVNAEQQKTKKALESAQVERDKAEEARKDERKRKEEAEAARKDAESQRDLARRAQEQEALQRAEAEKAREEEERQRAAAETARAEAERARKESEERERIGRHRLGVSDLTRAEQLVGEKRWFEASLFAARAVGFKGLGAAPPGREKDSEFGEYLLPESSETGRAQTVVLDAPRIFPFWSSPLVDHFGSDILCVTFHPGGRLLAAATRDGEVSIWDADSGKRLKSHREHGGYVNMVVFSPDGKSLASCSDDMRVVLWGVEGADSPRTFWGHEGGVKCIAFHPDSSRIASLGNDTLRLFDAESGREVPSFKIRNRLSPCSLEFGPAGKTIAVGGFDELFLFDAATGETLVHEKDISGPQAAEEIDCVSFSPDGRRLALCHGKFKEVLLFDVAERKWAGKFGSFDRNPLRVRFDATGKRLLVFSGGASVWDMENGGKLLEVKGYSVSSDADSGLRKIARARGGFLELLDFQTGRSLNGTEYGIGSVDQLAFSPDDRFFAASNGYLKVFEAATGAVVKTFPGDGHYVEDFTFTPDGATLVVLDGRAGNYSLSRWNLETGEITVLRSDELARDGAHTCAFSSDASLMVTTTAAGSMNNKYFYHVFDTATGARISEAGQEPVRPFAVALSPDKAVVALGDDNGPIGLFERESGREIAILQGHDDCVRKLVFSADGSRLASASDDASVRLWDTQTRKLLVTFPGFNTFSSIRLAFSPAGDCLVTSNSTGVEFRDMQTYGRFAALSFAGETVAFSHDGKTLAVTEKGVIRMVRTGRRCAFLSLEGHENPVLDVAVDPTMKAAVTSSSDGSILRWDMEAGKPVATWKPPKNKDFVRTVAFSPDGKRLVSGGMDCALHVWDPKTGTELETMAKLEDQVMTVRYAPDGSALAASCRDDTIGIWDMPGGKLKARFEGSGPCFSFSRNSRKLISSSGNRTLKVFDVRGAALEKEMTGDLMNILSVAVHPDGVTAVTGGGDPYVKGFELHVWDLGKGKVVQVLKDARERLDHLEFSPDGSLLAAAELDGRILVWDWASRRLMTAFSEGTFGQYGARVFFTPDGESVLSCGFGNDVQIWSLAMPDLASFLTVGSFEEGVFKFNARSENLFSGENPWDGIRRKFER